MRNGKKNTHRAYGKEIVSNQNSRSEANYFTPVSRERDNVEIESVPQADITK